MAPKGRKSFNNLWYSCEQCGVTLTHKDVQQHNSLSCPPDYTDWTYAFIKDQILYSFFESCDNIDIPKIQEHEKQFFVFLSQSAMQLCHFEIGDQVVLQIKNNDTIIRTVWPTSEKTLSSVLVPNLHSAINQKWFEDNNGLKVKKLTSKPIPASLIYLTSSTEITLSCIDQILILCKQMFVGKLLQSNSVLNLPFYGKTINFNVKNILPIKHETEDSLVHQLQELNIHKSISKELCFIVVESSKWEIFPSNKNNETEVNLEDTSISKIGGYRDIIEELMRSISCALDGNESKPYFSSSLGILLYGPNGVGKTFITHAIAKEMNVRTVKINSGELFSKFYGETELRLRALFTEAKDFSPSIIILDNVDTLCPKQGRTEQERRVITYLVTLLDSLRNFRVVVLANTSQLNLIDSSLRRPGRLDFEIELPIPSVTDRFNILKVLLSQWEIKDSDVMNIALVAHGYVAADLKSLVTKAGMKAVEFNKTNVEISNLYWALSQIKPSAMREVLVQVPNVKWTDIGGLDDLKLKLQQAIEWPLRHPESFSRLGISPPRGILMYGPPGCSKTMIAKALATESKLNFLSIKSSDLFSKWVGESEKAVQTLFKKARAVAPSIVFLDELDALGGERSDSGEGNNVQERVLSQLLTEMDGVEPLGNVNVVAATNRPDRIDKALLRPGRLDRMVYVPLPDLATRICILQLQLIKMPVASDIVIDDLALKTEGFSGAEVVAVCNEAAMNALQEDFNINEVCERHFLSALEVVKPRTPQSLLKLYDSYLKP